MCCSEKAELSSVEEVWSTYPSQQSQAWKFASQIQESYLEQPCYAALDLLEAVFEDFDKCRCLITLSGGVPLHASAGGRMVKFVSQDQDRKEESTAELLILDQASCQVDDFLSGSTSHLIQVMFTSAITPSSKHERFRIKGGVGTCMLHAKAFSSLCMTTFSYSKILS